MYHHTETEHPYNNIHRKNDDTSPVQYIKNAIINQIHNQRIDCTIHRFAQSDKDIIHYRAPGICHIERDELNRDPKNFVSVSQMLSVAIKRRP